MFARFCLILGAVLGLVPATASAQGHQRLCTEASVQPSFAPTEKNRLPDAQIKARLFGNTFGYKRASRNQVHNLRYTIFFRPDGSSLVKCESQRVGTSDWRACAITGDPKSGRIVGAWRIENSQLCGKMMLTSTEPGGCFSIHESGGRIAAKQVSGDPACLEGDWEPM